MTAKFWLCKDGEDLSQYGSKKPDNGDKWGGAVAVVSVVQHPNLHPPKSDAREKFDCLALVADYSHYRRDKQTKDRQPRSNK